MENSRIDELQSEVLGLREAIPKEIENLMKLDAELMRKKCVRKYF
jgi:hypothetical protein